MAVFGVLIELAIFRPLRNTAPLAKLAASLGLLLVLESAMILIFGNSLKSAPSVLPSGTVTVFDRVVPTGPVPARGDRDPRRRAADRALPLDALRPGDAGGIRERGLGDARRPVSEPSRDHEHRPRLRRRWRAGSAGRAAHRARLADAGVPGRAGSGGCPPRRVHIVLHRLLCRARDRRDPVASPLLVDANLVPDRLLGNPDPRATRSCSSSSSSSSPSSCEEQTSPAAESSSRGGSPPFPGPSAC